jgi:hypothetical protein
MALAVLDWSHEPPTVTIQSATDPRTVMRFTAPADWNATTRTDAEREAFLGELIRRLAEASAGQSALEPEPKKAILAATLAEHWTTKD